MSNSFVNIILIIALTLFGASFWYYQNMLDQNEDVSVFDLEQFLIDPIAYRDQVYNNFLIDDVCDKFMTPQIKSLFESNGLFYIKSINGNIDFGAPLERPMSCSYLFPNGVYIDFSLYFSDFDNFEDDILNQVPDLYNDPYQELLDEYIQDLKEGTTDNFKYTYGTAIDRYGKICKSNIYHKEFI